MIRAALDAISLWAIPVLLVVIPLAGLIRGVKVYDVFIEGAKEGFEVGVKIIPFLVGILVAIGMFRGSGAMELLTSALRPVAAATGFPAELVPLAILRSLTGSGSLAFTTDLIKTSRRGLAPRPHGRHDVWLERDDVLRAGGVLRRRRRPPHAPRCPRGARGRHRCGDCGSSGVCLDVLVTRITRDPRNPRRSNTWSAESASTS